MSAEAANRLREHLGDATGIAVRTGRKVLQHRGIEVVPADSFQPVGTVYYRGRQAGTVVQVGSGEWVTANGRRFRQLTAAVLASVLRHLVDSGEPARAGATSAHPS